MTQEIKDEGRVAAYRNVRYRDELARVGVEWHMAQFFPGDRKHRSR